MFSSGPDQPGDGLGRLFDLAVGLVTTSCRRPYDAVVEALIEKPSATDCSALVIADTWVRMSMQYFSSSTIFWRPRA